MLLTKDKWEKLLCAVGFHDYGPWQFIEADCFNSFLNRKWTQTNKIRKCKRNQCLKPQVKRV